jgi:hypothetical protein
MTPINFGFYCYTILFKLKIRNNIEFSTLKRILSIRKYHGWKNIDYHICLLRLIVLQVIVGVGRLADLFPFGLHSYFSLFSFLAVFTISSFKLVSGMINYGYFPITSPCPLRANLNETSCGNFFGAVKTNCFLCFSSL